MSSSNGDLTLEELLDGPAMAPPPGEVSDFVNNGAHHVLGYAVILFVSILTTIAMIMRLYSRYLMKRFRIEDVCLIIAFGFSLGYQYIVYQFAVSPGLHVHQWNVPLREMIHVLFHLHLASLFFAFAIIFLKTAILLDWIDLFVLPGERNYFYWISHFLIWSNAIFYLVGNMAEIFSCTPREKIWDKTVPGTCPIDVDYHMKASCAINLISDVAILLLPQKIIWALNWPFRRKVGVSLLFAIGVFACFSGGFRIYYTLLMIHSEDKLYAISFLGLWVDAEMSAGFLIMGVPALPITTKSLWEGSLRIALWAKNFRDKESQNMIELPAMPVESLEQVQGVPGGRGMREFGLVTVSTEAKSATRPDSVPRDSDVSAISKQEQNEERLL